MSKGLKSILNKYFAELGGSSAYMASAYTNKKWTTWMKLRKLVLDSADLRKWQIWLFVGLHEHVGPATK
jgi:hypothetical protein